MIQTPCGGIVWNPARRTGRGGLKKVHKTAGGKMLLPMEIGATIKTKTTTTTTMIILIKIIKIKVSMKKVKTAITLKMGGSYVKLSALSF